MDGEILNLLFFVEKWTCTRREQISDYVIWVHDRQAHDK